MQDMKLVEASVVTDDSTGIWQMGELEYGVPGTTVPWLEKQPGRRKQLADWLRMLADRCENNQSPFESHAVPSPEPVASTQPQDGRIQKTSESPVKHRPRFDTWSARFTLRINNDILPIDFIHQLLNEGGQQIGIGDYRPEKGGPFGTFNVVKWEEHK